MSKKKPVPPPETDIQKKFELKCHKDYNLNVITRLVGKTFWIYAPTENPLFEMGAATPSPPDPFKKSPKYDLLFADGNFKSPVFNFQYDVTTKTKTDMENEGISTQGTDYFNKLYNNLFTAITETMLDAKNVAFIVMDICDIKKGIEARYTFYLEDYRMASVEGLPYDEFSKRVLQETKGSTDYIGDEVGQHLEYNDIQMGDFLAKQILHRLHYTFGQSDFPPQQNYEETILSIISDVLLRYYHFQDFKEVHTDDLRAHKQMIFNRAQLDNFGEDKAKPEKTSNGKLIHIIFENGKTTFKDQ